jgi:repressor LexA
MLKIKGESMINAGIPDGSHVLVQQQDSARDGDIVVALLNDSATVKTFYREKDHIRLQPENDFMDPIIVQEVEILGKVVSLIRYF